MERNSNKLQDKKTLRRRVNLPEMGNVEILTPEPEYVTEGVDFSFFVEAWKEIKKVAHKIGAW
ncbi:hypothetical protein [Chitinophaga sp. 22620]|uniref:hypothetical protein n=1 Tax=Chitinophaga sp. 22620 TaxID=3453952 RepID=UPI003F8512F8